LPPDFLGQVNSIQWRGKHLLKEVGLLLLGCRITAKKVNPIKKDFHVSRSIKFIAEVEYKTTERQAGHFQKIDELSTSPTGLKLEVLSCGVLAIYTSIS
jgi:hypothetical protein